MISRTPTPSREQRARGVPDGGRQPAAHPGAPGGPGRTDPAAAAAGAVVLRGRRRHPHPGRPRAAPPAGWWCCTTRTVPRPGTASCGWSATPRPSSTPDMAGDPLLPAVGWSWLTEALDAARRRAHARSAAPSPRPPRPGSATCTGRQHHRNSSCAAPGPPTEPDLCRAPARLRRPARAPPPACRRKAWPSSVSADASADPTVDPAAAAGRDADPRPNAACRCCASPRDGYPGADRAPPTELAARGGRAGGRHRTGRRRRRARVRLPLQPARLPGPAAPRRRRHRADRPDPRCRTCSRWTTRSPTPSGSCTPPTRTCPAWPSSACARAGCSTPSWPAGCSATSGSRSARWSSSTSASRWRRATRRPTGRPGRCRTTGWSTPRWTSSC